MKLCTSMVLAMGLTQAAAQYPLYAQASKGASNRGKSEAIAKAPYKEIETIDQALDYFLQVVNRSDMTPNKKAEEVYANLQFKKRVFAAMSQKLDDLSRPEIKETIKKVEEFFINACNQLQETAYRSSQADTDIDQKTIDQALNKVTELYGAYDNATLIAAKIRELETQRNNAGIANKGCAESFKRVFESYKDLIDTQIFSATGLAHFSNIFEQIERNQITLSATSHCVEVNKKYNDDLEFIKKHKLDLKLGDYTDAVNRFNTELEHSSSSKATEESYFKVLNARKELYDQINKVNPDLYNQRISSDPTINNATKWFNIYQKNDKPSQRPREELKPSGSISPKATAIIAFGA